MAKEEMISLDDVIEATRAKNGFDEAVIAKYASKSIVDLSGRMKAIDKQYDARFKSLEAGKKARYNKHYDNLVAQRKEVYQLLKMSKNAEEREKFLDLYLNIVSKLDSLFASAESYDEKRKEELIVMREDKKKETFVWMVLESAVPIIASAIATGIKLFVMSASNDKQTKIGS